jgi:hypothetical protein
MKKKRAVKRNAAVENFKNEAKPPWQHAFVYVPFIFLLLLCVVSILIIEHIIIGWVTLVESKVIV